MDPDVVLAMFYAATKRADESETGSDQEIDLLRRAVDHAADLFEWLRKGGYAPDWRKTS